MHVNRHRIYDGLLGAVFLPFLVGAQGGGCLSSVTQRGGDGGVDSAPHFASSYDKTENGTTQTILPVWFPGNPNTATLTLPLMRPDCLAYVDCEITSNSAIQPSDLKLVRELGCWQKGEWATHEVMLGQGLAPGLKNVFGSTAVEPQHGFESCLDPDAETFGLPFYSAEIRMILTREETAYGQDITFKCDYSYVPFPTWRDDDCPITSLIVVNQWTETIEVKVDARHGGTWSATIEVGEQATFRLPPGFCRILDRTSAGWKFFDAFLLCEGGTVTYKSNDEGAYAPDPGSGLVWRDLPTQSE